MIGGAVLLVAVGPHLQNPTFEAYKSAGVAAGVLLSLAGHLFTQGRASRDLAEKESKFYLDSAVLALEEARKLLEDGNNNRTTWIAAARSLMHAHDLADMISIDAHRKVLELHKLKYRSSFRNAITNKPAAFYYGAEDPTVSLDKAAEDSTARTTSAGGRPVTSTLTSLPEAALYAVWKACQWPADYQDHASWPISGRRAGKAACPLSRAARIFGAHTHVAFRIRKASSPSKKVTANQPMERTPPCCALQRRSSAR